MAEVEWQPGHRRIFVRGLPDEVAVENLSEKLHDLIVDRQIKGVSDIYNLSADDTPLLMVQLRPDANPQAVVDEIRGQVPTDE